MNRTELATTAMRRATEIRRSAGISRTSPLNIYDVAMDKLDLRVQFIAGGSFEGMFAKEQNTILVPSDRPHGRRAFSAAHEVGHWAFGHGSQIDEEDALDKYNQRPEEQLANQFAGHVLMTPAALKQATEKLGLNLARPSPYKIYEMACWFGVGYSTLVNHLQYGVQQLESANADVLLRLELQKIRQHFSPRHSTKYLAVASGLTPAMPLDLAVGDHALLPTEAVLPNEILAITERTTEGLLVEAKRPGIALVSGAGGWAAAVRVMKKGFTGWAKYRHMEDDDDENE